MPEITQLQALSDRLDGLSGADREADAMVADALNAWRHGPTGLGGWCRYPARTFTASLDETIWLVERALGPEWFWRAGRSRLYAGWATLNDRYGKDIFAHAPTAPLALLRALVAAKLAEASISTKSGVE